MRLFLLALATGTRLPVPGARRLRESSDADALVTSLRLLPIVGLIVGFVQSLVYVGAGLLLPHSVAVLLAIAAGLLVTGARSESGLVRCFDTLASPAGAAGAVGTSALALLLILRFETLSNIGSDWLAVTLICGQGFSRACLVLGRLQLPTPGGQRPTRAADAGIAFVLAWLAPIVLVAWTGAASPVLVSALLALATTIALRRAVRRRYGPATDAATTGGAAQQLAEAAFYVGMLMLAMTSEEAAVPEDEETIE